ncbi:hypothetical protein I3760_04G184300 [Carya illinoinensis]|nr:hypothetical protein I3760_04G184300 [Carya illinoinensis]
MDQELVSSWPNVQFVPDSYVRPPEERPGKLVLSSCKTNIPVVDLEGHDETQIILHIMKATKDFGFFQAINHGVPKVLMDEAMAVFKEFHAMTEKDKTSEGSKDPSRNCSFYRSSKNYQTEDVHVWRDVLTHPCHDPLEEHMKFWPAKPTRYRDVVGKYVVELRKLGEKILELLCEGLGLGASYFSSTGLSGNPVLLVNHYPPCPDPSLTLGLIRHMDPSLITILLQVENGLQVFKDGEWIAVEPLPHAFVLNVGLVLQIISNGKLKGAEHRAVTNSTLARTSAAFFIYPCNDIVIEPEKALTNACNPPLFRSVRFKEFQSNFLSRYANSEAVLQFLSTGHKH